jgi:hypothetical protein
MIWRLVTRKVATLQEVRTFWDIIDVLTANEALDLQDDADWLASRPSPTRGHR